MALVMFDLDGTLLDTAGEIGDSVNRTLAEFGHANVSDQDVRRWIGHGTGWLMKQAWAAAAGNANTSNWDHVMSRFIEHYYDCAGTSSTPYPFVMETLDQLKSIGVKCAVITNKEARFTDRILEKHHLVNAFDMVICGDTLPVKKPNPEVIFHCLGGLSQAAGESLFVGDSEIDVATAKAAGVTCWAVPYGYNMGRPIESAQPDLVVPNIQGVPNYFKGVA
jgi:phosphoglycolate phosphatase